MSEIKKPCKREDCRGWAVFKGYCQKHRPEEFKSARRERLPGNWAGLREAVLRRDERICYICGGKGADSVDHLTPGDDHSMSNLKACHLNVAPFCHRKKTAREGNQRQGHNSKGTPHALPAPEIIKWDI